MASKGHDGILGKLSILSNLAHCINFEFSNKPVLYIFWTSYLPIKQSHRFSNLSNFCNNSMVWSISTKFDTWPMSSCLKARLCHFKWFFFISDTFLELSDKFLLKYIQKSKKSLFVSWITLWLKSFSKVNHSPLFLVGQSYKFWN